MQRVLFLFRTILNYTLNLFYSFFIQYICEKLNMKWIKIVEKDKLPEKEVLAYSERNHEYLLGYLNFINIVNCENEHELLNHISHYLILEKPSKNK